VTVGSPGGLVLATTKVITLGHANAKIEGKAGTTVVYDITPADGEITGTLTAGTASTAVVFKASSIEGYTDSGESLALAASDPASAATLDFGVKDSVLAIKENTAIAGVILGVATNGIITVPASKTLTLGLGVATNHVGSGGISTAEGNGYSTITMVKANGVQNGTPLSLDTLAGLAGANVTGTGAVGSVMATTPAAGVISPSSNLSIDAGDVFAVLSSAITVTHT
jgi:hypothetical protein